MRLDEFAVNEQAAGRRLQEGLSYISGRYGVGQRAFKGDLKSSDQAADNSRFGDWGALGSRSGGEIVGGDQYGGGGLGGGGSVPPPAAAPSRVQYFFDDSDSDYAKMMMGGAAGSVAGPPARRVKQLAGRSLFFKNGRWEDAGLTEEQAKDPTKIEQFSDAYFALVKQAGEKLAPLLTLDEPALVRIGGTTYLIEPPAAEPAGETDEP